MISFAGFSRKRASGVWGSEVPVISLIVPVMAFGYYSKTCLSTLVDLSRRLGLAMLGNRDFGFWLRLFSWGRSNLRS